MRMTGITCVEQRQGGWILAWASYQGHSPTIVYQAYSLKAAKGVALTALQRRTAVDDSRCHVTGPGGR
jgi:hypothetical protein